MEWAELDAAQRFLLLAAMEGTTPLGEKGEVWCLEVPAEISGLVGSIKVPSDAGSSRDFLKRNLSSVLLKIPCWQWKSIFSRIDCSEARIAALHFEHLVELSERCCQLLAAERHEFGGAWLCFVAFLCKALSWEERSSITFENLTLPVVSLALPYLTLPATMPVLVTVLSGTGQEPRERLLAVRDIHRWLQTAHKTVAGDMLNVVLGPSPAVQEYLRSIHPDEHLVPLAEEELRSVFLSDSYHRSLREMFIRFLGRMPLNPYRPEKPVDREDMFFGRLAELDLITEHQDTDFLVVGARKIGKSSLAKAVERVTKQRQIGIPVVIDCSVLPEGDPELAVVRAIAGVVDPRRADRVTMSTLARVVRLAHSRVEQRFIFALDEVDDLVGSAAANNHWQLFAVLRSLAQDEIAQTIFTGYRQLYRACRSRSSPLYNFVTPVWLSTLAPDAARRLAIEPMERLGIRYESPEVVEELVVQAGYHPSLLQFACRTLVAIADASRSNKLHMYHLQALISDPSYSEFMLRLFEHRENLGPEAQLILWSIALQNIDELSVADTLDLVEDSVQGVDAGRIVDSLLDLEIGGFLTASSGMLFEPRTQSSKYRVTVPGLPRLLAQTFPAGRFVEGLAAGLRRKGGN